MKRIFCLLVALIAVPVSADERLSRFVGEFEATVEQQVDHTEGAAWTTSQVALSGRWIVSKHYAELRGTFRFPAFEKPIELVFLWSYDPFQKEYRLAVLDDLAGLLDVFEQQSANPLALANVSHGTYFQDAEGRRSFNRVTVHFLDNGAMRMHWSASADGGKSWSDFARLTMKRKAG